APRHAQALEGLRARYLMDEMAVDIKQARAVALRFDQVVVPDFIVERSLRAHCFAFRFPAQLLGMSRPDCKTFDGGTSPGIPLGEVREKLNVAEPVSFCKIDIVCGYERRAVLDGGRVIHRVEEMMFKLDGQLSRL